MLFRANFAVNRLFVYNGNNIKCDYALHKIILPGAFAGFINMKRLKRVEEN